MNSDSQKILSVRQVATLMNTSRQNIFDLIYRGRINPARKDTPNKEYEITPAMLADLAQSQATNLIAMLGVYAFAEILHAGKLISDEQYNAAKTQFKSMLDVAGDIPALKDIVDEIQAKMPALKD